MTSKYSHLKYHCSVLPTFVLYMYENTVGIVLCMGRYLFSASLFKRFIMLMHEALLHSLHCFMWYHGHTSGIFTLLHSYKQILLIHIRSLYMRNNNCLIVTYFESTFCQCVACLFTLCGFCCCYCFYVPSLNRKILIFSKDECLHLCRLCWFKESFSVPRL